MWSIVKEKGADSMKNKKVIIGIVVALIVITGFIIFSNIQKQNLIDENQGIYDEFEAKVIAGDTSNCESNVDKSLFPEVVDLEGLCYFNKGMDLYEDAFFIDAMIDFDHSLSRTDIYQNEIDEMKTGIELILNSTSVNTVDQIFKFDMENEFSFFNELMAFITIHPFINSDQTLIKHQYLPQIIGLDNWTDGTNNFRFYEGTLYSDIPRFNNGDASKVFYQVSTSGDFGWNVPNSFGVIMMEEDSGDAWSWEYRYQIIDLDTIIIYSLISDSQYTLNRVFK